MSKTNSYVGRFAPSPTGPLHFGSLVAALASFLDARANQGQWLLRIEDLDPPRESLTAPAEIMMQLQTYGLEWDESPLFQSTRLEIYAEALRRLTEDGFTYRCTCSRKSTRGVYPGTCRSRHAGNQPAAIRLLTKPELIEFEDQILGLRTYHLEHDIGDFIVRRKDGLFAYQLAVVVDDDAQHVTHVIRGSDLLDSTPRQLFLGRCLGISSPAFAHFPVILGHDGQKLSKQTHAAPLETEDPPTVLASALRALGQHAVKRNVIHKMLDRAIELWSMENVPKQLNLSYASL